MINAHKIDYKISGDHCQTATIGLDINETVVADAGSLLGMDSGVEMNTIMGDGSEKNNSGIVSTLVGAGSRLLVGEGLFMTTFTNTVGNKKVASFAAPFPGKIIPIDLAETKHNTLIAQRDAFLCGAKGVSISLAFQKKILAGIFGGEGFVLQKLEGDGLIFLSCGGNVLTKTLKENETFKIDTGCLVCMEPSVAFDVQRVSGIKNMVFGGEGIFLASLTGPGKIWLQSMPASKLAAQILSRSGARIDGVFSGVAKQTTNTATRIGTRHGVEFGINMLKNFLRK